MKFLKKTAIAAMTLSLALSACAFASCNGDDSSVEAAVCYSFIVKKADGSAAQNVSIQLCSYTESGELSTCYRPIAVDENGRCDYTAAPEAGVYEIHILHSGTEYVVDKEGHVEIDGSVQTPAEYGEVIVTLK